VGHDLLPAFCFVYSPSDQPECCGSCDMSDRRYHRQSTVSAIKISATRVQERLELTRIADQPFCLDIWRGRPGREQSTHTRTSPASGDLVGNIWRQSRMPRNRGRWRGETWWWSKMGLSRGRLRVVLCRSVGMVQGRECEML
jgi:hypothetical protein